jgi:hypothetical protein
MKTAERVISKSLQEVWEWKEAVYRETKDKNLEETKAYFRKGLQRAAKIIGARLKKNPDGSYVLI